MNNVIGVFIALFGTCLGLGLIVSKVEKKKGWVKDHKPYGIYEKHLKRPIDFSLALYAMILFWPIILIIAITVRVNMGKPVVFTQERPGLGGKIFTMRKFRTMTDARDSDGNLLPDEQRLTRFGKWLRASSGDEVLELVSIIKGDLALVGPRPLLVEYLPRYSKEQAHRHDVRPGLTGFAQTEGRNLCTWEEKFTKDIEYIHCITFLGDFKILAKTVMVVLSKKGVNSNNSSTMEDFMGSNK